MANTKTRIRYQLDKAPFSDEMRRLFYHLYLSSDEDRAYMLEFISDLCEDGNLFDIIQDEEESMSFRVVPSRELVSLSLEFEAASATRSDRTADGTRADRRRR